FLPYNPRLFAVRGAFSNGGDSTAARRRQQAAFLSPGGRRFAACGVRKVPGARGILRPQGARGARGAARRHGAREALDRPGRAALGHGGAARARIPPSSTAARATTATPARSPTPARPACARAATS